MIKKLFYSLLIKKSSTTAFQVKNDSDMDVFTVDTTNQTLGGTGISSLQNADKVVQRNSNGDIDGTINLQGSQLPQLSAVDLFKASIKTGFYICTDCTNTPNGQDGYLFYGKSTSGNVSLEYTAKSNGKKYGTIKNGSTWGVWKQTDEPIGIVKYTASSTLPLGHLKANGAAVSRIIYADLFAEIGVTYGVGEGINTFNLPDGRGVVARGCDDGRGLDSGRVLGSYQADENKLHGHTASSGNGGLHGHTYTAPSGNIRSSGNDAWTINTSVSATTSLDGLHNHPITVDANGGTEVRMKNIALLAIIKY